MKRSGFIVALLGLLVLLVFAIPATAQEDFYPHPHMLLQRPVVDLIDGVPHLVGYRKCVDLASNQAVPLHAHHARLHFGTSGVSFGGESGHAVAPTAPFGAPVFPMVPWGNCAEFATYLPLPIPPPEE